MLLLLQLLQLFLMGQVLQPPATLAVFAENASCFPCLSCMGDGVGARLGAVLQMQCNKHWVEGNNRSPSSAGWATVDASQEACGLCCCLGTQLAVCWDPQAFVAELLPGQSVASFHTPSSSWSQNTISAIHS